MQTFQNYRPSPRPPISMLTQTRQTTHHIKHTQWDEIVVSLQIALLYLSHGERLHYKK